MRDVRSERGAAAVELALLLPLLIILVLGTVEFARAFQAQSTLAAAAREGARVFSLGNEAAVGTAVQSGTASLDDPDVTGDEPAFSVAVTDAAGNPIASASCDGAPADSRARVTVAHTLPYITDFFGSGINLSADGVMRCNG